MLVIILLYINYMLKGMLSVCGWKECSICLCNPK